ncbi:hypothetical protein BJV78DRAFT_668200 [Lactifluus subvellereus]|nr:hypothetical protein BJV78DRAFT_668200 [Lactifluus subvellereus]
MRITNTPDFITPLNTTYRSLRHFPRSSTRQGLNHTTIIIAVSASVGSVLVAILCWRIFSHLSGRSRSAPLPPRQALVHQREHRLAAFSEHKNASIPQHYPMSGPRCLSTVVAMRPLYHTPMTRSPTLRILLPFTHTRQTKVLKTTRLL